MSETRRPLRHLLPAAAPDARRPARPSARTPARPPGTREDDHVPSLTARLRRGVATLAAATLLGPLALAAGTTPAAAAEPGSDWLRTRGNQVVDAAGNPVWLTGANWFGFNTTERVFHGLWSVNMEEVTRSLAGRGINIVRVPISTRLLMEWRAGAATTSGAVNTSANPELAGKTTLQVFDHFLALAEKYGLKVMLDVHSAEADNMGHMAPLWYGGSVTAEDFYSTWEWVATRYRTDDTLVAFDLKNEPHGIPGQGPRAKWDASSDADNWRHAAQTAARRVLAINPDVLVLVEGVEAFPRSGTSWASSNPGDYTTTWWGGNLRGVRDLPIDLGANQDQLVYSPHDYGPLVHEQPWFAKPFDRASLTADVWRPNWLYIHEAGTAPLLVGEWGGRVGQDARQDRWMTALRDLLVDERIHHTFWAVNPNSGDTGGLLLDDWRSWDEAKYAVLKPALWQHQGRFVGLDHQVPLGGAGSTTGISLDQRYGGGATDTTAPTVPTGLTATGRTPSSVSLRWNASTDTGGSGLAGYDVYRGTAKVASVPGTTVTVTGLAASTEYTFTVRARDAAGNTSGSSAALRVSTTAPTADTTPPTRPGRPVATAVTPTSVSLRWTPSTDTGSGVVGYDLYRGTMKVTSVSGPSVTVTGLRPRTTYGFHVRARDAAGNTSDASAVLDVRTPTQPAPSGGVTVRYRNNDTAPADNQIRSGLQVANTGTTAVDLTGVTLRYWFTRDGGATTFGSWCDWAAVGCDAVSTRVVTLPTPVAGADAYLEVAFARGSLAPGATTGDIQLRVAKTDWSDFDETDDHSRTTGTTFADNPRVTAHRGTTLLWGTPPA